MSKFSIRNDYSKSESRFPHKTLKERLIKDKAIDMRNNYELIDQEDGYIRVVPKDMTKLYK